jgi:hypothetical protein
MTHFIAERYLARADAADLDAVAARARGAAGPDVRYVRTLYLPADEICLHEFVSSGPDALRAALVLHGVPFDQLGEAVLERKGASR